MQVTKREYDPEQHDCFKALTVKQPFAEALVSKAREDEDGNTYAIKDIEIRSRKTNYRGDILICSAKEPIIRGYECGATLGMVELYDCKPVADMTEEEWERTRILPEVRKTIKYGYAYMFRNPRKVIEYPVMGAVGIYNIYYTKGDIRPYPTRVVLDKEAYAEIMRDMRRNGK